MTIFDVYDKEILWNVRHRVPPALFEKSEGKRKGKMLRGGKKLLKMNSI